MRISLDYFAIVLVLIILILYSYTSGNNLTNLSYIIGDFISATMVYYIIKKINTIVNKGKTIFGIAIGLMILYFAPRLGLFINTKIISPALLYPIFKLTELFPLLCTIIYINTIKDLRVIPAVDEANDNLALSDTANISTLQKNHSQLGKGATVLDKVISSLLERANSSNRMTTTSLIIMCCIVFVGGMASVGTVAINDFRKIRQLENETGNVIELKNLLAAKLNKNNCDSSIINYIERIFVDDAGIIKQSSIKREASPSFNWQDIAMKITIAALTLFLVQVFFHIYKYNQKQASQLYTRAETIELFKGENANGDELRTSLLTKMSPDPSFDKSPPSPSEQIINVIERATSKT